MPYADTNGKSHSSVCLADHLITHPCLCLSSRPCGRFLFLANRFHGKNLPLVNSHLIYLGLQYIEEFCGMGTVHLSVVELER